MTLRIGETLPDLEIPGTGDRTIRQGFPFDLLSDKNEVLCRAFGVIKLKKLYGKESLGIERSTFLIDGEGRLHWEWRGVKVKGHAEQVLVAARGLAEGA
jgi:peroxiredoxin Q/BCP